MVSCALWNNDICLEMTLSVVIATYNGEKFLREQIDSVLAQTLKPDEIIVSDDGSTDGTWQILEEYRSKYPKLFRLYRNEKGLGPHENFKHAFQYVTCDLVAPCDQDDIWMPEKLERCVAAMDKDTSLVFCDEVIKQEDGRLTKMHHIMPKLRDCIFGKDVYGHVMVCRKEMLDVFSLGTEITFDWGLTLYAALFNSGKGIDYEGCIWRRHAQTVTSAYAGHGGKIKLEIISKWTKLFRTMRMLRSGEMSVVLGRRMESIGSIIKHFAPNRKEGYVALYVSEQRVGSMLKACYTYMKIVTKEDAYKEASLRNKIGMAAYAFCYPAMYWYDYHKHDSL